MISPSQITSQRFSPNGKGGYKAAEVDVFLQRIYQSYNQVIAENKALTDKLAYIEPQIEEYNKNKSSIAQALILAQGTSDEIIAGAKTQAEAVLKAKQEEADLYYTQKTADADRALEKAEEDFRQLQEKSDLFAEAYIAKVNEKAEALISKANTLAAEIISQAELQAKQIKAKADETVKEAENQLIKLQKETDKIRQELSNVISFSQKSIDSIADIKLPEDISATEDGFEITPPTIDKDEIEAFSFENAQMSEESEKDVFSIEILDDDIEEENSGVFETSQQTEQLDNIFDHNYFAPASDEQGVPEERKAQTQNAESIPAFVDIISNAAAKNGGSFTLADIISEAQKKNSNTENQPKDSDSSLD
ncbi:MAG: DivIVA domain-containing protein [Acutalibacteraceae bacterium]